MRCDVLGTEASWYRVTHIHTINSPLTYKTFPQDWKRCQLSNCARFAWEKDSWHRPELCQDPSNSLIVGTVTAQGAGASPGAAALYVGYSWSHRYSCQLDVAGLLRQRINRVAVLQCPWMTSLLLLKARFPVTLWRISVLFLLLCNFITCQHHGEMQVSSDIKL